MATVAELIDPELLKKLEKLKVELEKADRRKFNKGKEGRHWEVKPKRVIKEKLPCHPDKGCDYAVSCLDCPFPVCLEDLSHSERIAYIKKHNLKKRDKNA